MVTVMAFEADFNPLPRKEGDLFPCRLIIKPDRFQSTPS